jgi:Ca2+-binding RTX toxin-like protein
MAIINGTSGNDNLAGTSTDDQIDGAAGNDRLSGKGGKEGVVKTSWSDIDAAVVGCKDGVPTKNSTNV